MQFYFGNIKFPNYTKIAKKVIEDAIKRSKFSDENG